MRDRDTTASGNKRNLNASKEEKRRKGNKSAEVKTSIGESEATGARRESEEFENMNPKNSLAAQTPSVQKSRNQSDKQDRSPIR